MKKYYIWSKKWTLPTDYIKTFYRPNSNGYTVDLDQAGVYTEKDINEHPDYNNGVDTVAIPIDEIKTFKGVRN